MAAPYHLIEDKCSRAFEAALVTALTGQLTGWNTYEMLNETTVTYPYIGVRVAQATISADRSGNYVCEVEVVVASQMAATTTAAHNDKVARVRDFLVGCMDDVVPDVNAAGITDFTAIGWDPQNVTTVVNDDDGAEIRLSTLIGACLCMPS